MIRILLVDDQNLIQEGIKALLDQHTELKVIGTVKDGRNAVKLVSLLHPDIVLLDIEMPGMDGITVTKHISRIAPETKVIILTSYEDKKYIMQSLLAGARGYILKSSLMRDLKQAILAVDNGYCQLESRLLAKVFNSNSIKFKKTKPPVTLNSEEKQQDEEHIAEYPFSEHKAEPSDKDRDFVNKDSQDVRTESEDNKFTVSPNSLVISLPIHSVLTEAEIQPVGSFNTLLTLPQIQPTEIASAEITNTLFNLHQTQFNQTQPRETSDTPHQTQPTEIISVETSNQGLTPSPTQPRETSDTLHQTQPTEIISVETSNQGLTPSATPPRETSDTLHQTQQENIQNLKVPLLPVVNRMALLMASEHHSSTEDNTEKHQKNKLAAKTSAFKNYFQQLISKKNLSRYKTNISIAVFKYRLVFHRYRVKTIQYTKLKISQYSKKNNKYQIKLERYKSKLSLLIKHWHEKKLFFNIGLMILGAAIFFIIHSIFN